ncbi:small subunit ribosomal protein S7e [Nematocida displodere]|uniref:40S ribosomal protein S7 n=1 Tax=Nematocida displodere TaxID=1805483 RepID=A0A177EJ67_9MICR|nr:small subunit ribosomal protein S7e [Nematocida displodere]
MTHAAQTDKSTQKEESKHAQSIVKMLRETPKEKKVADAVFEKVEVVEFTKDSVLITVVVVPTSLLSAVKKTLGAVIGSIENAIGGTVFIIRRRVASGLKEGEKRFRTGPTYKDYQEAVAKDLAAPSHIVDRRTLVRADGSRLEKIITDIKCKKELAHRFAPMGLVFEELFGKKTSFQANYY